MTAENSSQDAYGAMRALIESLHSMAGSQQLLIAAIQRVDSEAHEARQNTSQILQKLADNGGLLSTIAASSKACDSRTETMATKVNTLVDNALSREDLAEVIKLGGAHTCPLMGADGKIQRAQPAAPAVQPWYQNRMLLWVLIIVAMTGFILAGGKVVDLKELNGILSDGNKAADYPLDKKVTEP